MKTIISHATNRGKRPYQEDRYRYEVTDDGILLAVFDGHGGGETSEFCASTLAVAFKEAGDNSSLPTIEGKLRGVFELLAAATNEAGPGSTASIVFIPSSLTHAYVGIVGDSPVILKNKDGEFWVAPEHNVRSNPAEVQKAKERGGTVYGGYLYGDNSMNGLCRGGLQLSRTFGDASLSSVISREPEIFIHELGKDSFVMVGSDGLLDPRHRSGAPAREITELIERGAKADDLVRYALNVPTEDNVTALLMRIVE